MISNIKGYDSKTLIESKPHRKFLENFESELLRGIGKLCVLKVIKNRGKDGTYGYELLQDIKELTQDMLVIKEGTLYPLLRNLEKGHNLSLIDSTRRIVDGRARKYYFITEDGKKVLSHLEGFFLKLLEAVSSINDFEISLKEDKYSYCPNCKARISYTDKDSQYCEICGFDLTVKNQHQEEST